jgi:hypothetical protein
MHLSNYLLVLSVPNHIVPNLSFELVLKSSVQDIGF